MLKNIFLFVTTVLVATSTSTGYGLADLFKGSCNVVIFLDWFNISQRYVSTNGLIILDFIPAFFLTIQAVLFIKDKQNVKGLFSVLALLTNLFGVFLVIRFANPIASQMAGWTPQGLPSDWISVKDEWLKYIGIHGVMGLLGWLCFVITYFVPGKNDSIIVRIPRFRKNLKNILAFVLTFIVGLSAPRLYDVYLFPILYDVSGATFVEIHRPLDLVMRKVGPILFTALLSINVLLAVLHFIEKSAIKGWLIVAALVFLLGDTFIALQYNRPVNDLFLTWTPVTLPTNWKEIRGKWLSYHLYRDIFLMLQLISVLLIYFVKTDKSHAGTFNPTN